MNHGFTCTAHRGCRRDTMTDLQSLKPKDHAEAVAIFRTELIGALTRRDLDHGELPATLKELASERYRPPGAETTRKFSVQTLERWYYAYKAGSLDALRPGPRSDSGRAQELTAEQRTLLCDIRREHPSASVPLILRTLTLDGRLSKDAVSASTVRRLFADEGLDRIPLRDGKGPKTRLRWEAERPGALWHGDVCYGPAISVGGKNMPVRIHRAQKQRSRGSSPWLRPTHIPRPPRGPELINISSEYDAVRKRKPKSRMPISGTFGSVGSAIPKQVFA